MVVRYDGKGKYYTNIISKEEIPVTIQTVTHRVHGNIHVRPEKRLKDELDNASGFIAVTNAQIFSTDGEVMQRTHFMTVNMDYVIWLVPDDELIEDTSNEQVTGNG